MGGGCSTSAATAYKASKKTGDRRAAVLAMAGDPKLQLEVMQKWLKAQVSIDKVVRLTGKLSTQTNLSKGPVEALNFNPDGPHKGIRAEDGKLVEVEIDFGEEVEIHGVETDYFACGCDCYTRNSPDTDWQLQGSFTGRAFFDKPVKARYASMVWQESQCAKLCHIHAQFLGKPAINMKVVEPVLNYEPWLRAFFLCGGCTNWMLALETFDELMKTYGKGEKEGTTVNIIMGAALNIADRDKFYHDSVEGHTDTPVDPRKRVQFYIDLVENGNKMGDPHELTPLHWRYVQSSWFSDDELAWANKNLAADYNSPEKIGDSCHMVKYTMENSKGVSVHKGAEFYDFKKATLANYMEYGGVCGAVSKFGATMCNAHIVPAMPVGQPGHCGMLWRCPATKEWTISNNVGGITHCCHHSGMPAHWTEALEEGLGEDGWRASDKITQWLTAMEWCQQHPEEHLKSEVLREICQSQDASSSDANMISLLISALEICPANLPVWTKLLSMGGTLPESTGDLKVPDFLVDKDRQISLSKAHTPLCPPGEIVAVGGNCPVATAGCCVLSGAKEPVYGLINSALDAAAFMCFPNARDVQFLAGSRETVTVGPFSLKFNGQSWDVSCRGDFEASLLGTCPFEVKETMALSESLKVEKNQLGCYSYTSEGKQHIVFYPGFETGGGMNGEKVETASGRDLAESMPASGALQLTAVQKVVPAVPPELLGVPVNIEGVVDEGQLTSCSGVVGVERETGTFEGWKISSLGGDKYHIQSLDGEYLSLSGNSLKLAKEAGDNEVWRIQDGFYGGVMLEGPERKCIRAKRGPNAVCDKEVGQDIWAIRLYPQSDRHLPKVKDLSGGRLCKTSVLPETAAKITDGTESEWFPVEEQPIWVELELEKPSFIDSVNIHWWGAYGSLTALTVLGQAEGSSDFEKIGERKEDTEFNGWTKILGGDKPVTKIRLEMDNPADDPWGLGKKYGLRGMIVKGTPYQDGLTKAMISVDRSPLPSTLSAGYLALRSKILVGAQRSMTSVAVANSQKPRNVALNCEVTAPSAKEREKNLVDGTQSEWFTPEAEPQTLHLKLGMPCKVDKVRVQWWGSYGDCTAMKVESKERGSEEWIYRGERTEEVGLNEWTELPGWPEPTEEVRVLLDNPRGDCFGLGKMYGLRGIELIGLESPDTMDLGQGARVFSDLEKPARLVDGTDSQVELPASGYNWMEVDFLSKVVLSDIEFVWGDSFQEDADVSVALSVWEAGGWQQKLECKLDRVAPNRKSQLDLGGSSFATEKIQMKINSTSDVNIRGLEVMGVRFAVEGDFGTVMAKLAETLMQSKMEKRNLLVDIIGPFVKERVEALQQRRK